MMKNVITILSIALLSTAVNAESNIIEQGPISNTEQPGSAVISELILVKNEDKEDLELWKILDTNKDKSISKKEAAASIAVVDNWHKLDTNHDANIDTEEFAQLFSLED